MTCGVPQGSVLGPLLWNIAYDYVLRLSGLRGIKGCVLVGYADDTLVLGFGESVKLVRSNLNRFMAYVVRRISALSLCVAAEKIEAVLFRGRRRVDLVDPLVRVGGVLIPVKGSMKYLGVMMDNRLNFKQHFAYIGTKVGKVTRALSHLLPNLRGPHEGKRRLYANIITSVYAVPIWAPALAASSDLKRQCRR